MTDEGCSYTDSDVDKGRLGSTNKYADAGRLPVSFIVYGGTKVHFRSEFAFRVFSFCMDSAHFQQQFNTVILIFPTDFHRFPVFISISLRNLVVPKNKTDFFNLPYSQYKPCDYSSRV